MCAKPLGREHRSKLAVPNAGLTSRGGFARGRENFCGMRTFQPCRGIQSQP